MKKYPDMKALFAAKEARRRKLANLPIPEKMEIAQRLQEIGRQAPGRFVKSKRGNGTLSVATSQPMKEKPSEEFRRFDEVMSGLLAVPYQELQQKLAEEKRAKAKRKKKRPTSTASSVPASSSGKRRAA